MSSETATPAAESAAEAATESAEARPAAASPPATGDLAERVRALVRGFSIEVTPKAALKVERFADHLAPGSRVMITFLPGSDLADTQALALRLAEEGFRPVPHFAARSFASEKQLASFAAALAEAGVREAVVLAGAVDEPLGPFASSMDLIGTGVFEGSGFTRLGLAGHPEGSPDIPDAALAEALAWKNQWAAAHPEMEVELVTQFCFEAEPVLAWERRIRAEGNRLPVQIGLPGPAQLKTLLLHAKNCGIGNSMRFLVKKSRDVTKLVTVNAPDQLLLGLAQGKDPEAQVAGVHLYPLGGLRKSAAWARAVEEGRFTLKEEGARLAVDFEAR